MTKQLYLSTYQIDDRCEFAYETAGQIEIQRENLAAAVAAFDKVSRAAALYQHPLFVLRVSGGTGGSLCFIRASQ